MSVSKENLSGLPLLTDAEKRQVLVEWNDTRSDYAQDECIHELFQSQAERTPDAVAIVFQDHSLTYRELNRRANQLAHYLFKLGVAPEVLVGICIERSLEMVVGLLGILKAGGAYVPLDPSYPQERLAFMLADAQAPVLLTQQYLLKRLHSLALPARASVAPQVQVTPYSLLLLDTDWPVIAGENEANPTHSVTPENLAYAIYTSGSTGQPKGVQVEHRALLNLVFWHQRTFAVSPDTRATQIAGLAFDASVWELWPYLAAGASVHLPGEATRTVPERLRDWLVAQAITVSFLPTPLTAAVLFLDWPASPILQTLLTGGEKLHHYAPPALPFKLVNNYGPTENTVVTTSGLVPANKSTNGSPSIGRPIANTQVYLLDSNLHSVSIGEPGELYVAGASLARGYLRRPAQTAERFIPNPFALPHSPSHAGARLYKTGDLARYLPNGDLEFLGRSDHQVKVRGFRIELGEVEAVLAQHPGVREAVVVAWPGAQGAEREPNAAVTGCDGRLVAYIVPRDGASPQGEVLRSFLSIKLPEYMLPSTVVTLETLPLTPNGKVDRRALPVPGRAATPETFVAPRTATEEMLVAIWAEVLGLEKVGVYDDFIALGGHSLLAAQVVFRVQDAFQVALAPGSLFESPTVAELAQTVEATPSREQRLLAPPILPAPRDRPIPLSSQQQQLWFMAELYPDRPIYNETCTIHVGSDVNVAALEQSLAEIIRRHEILRTTFAVMDGKPAQVVHAPAPFNLPLVDLSELAQAERETEALRWATQELQRPFDLSQGPLFRATLMRLGVASYRLYLALHHIVTDGISLYDTFFSELQTLYAASSEGRPVALPEPKIQYADFAVWQQGWLQGAVLSTQLTYWKQKLAALPALQLPTDHPRPAEMTFRGARQCLSLSKSLTQKLKTLSQQEGVTLFTTLATAVATLLYRYSAQEDVVMGTFTAGRDRPEVEGVMGDFLNTVVLRLDLSGRPSFHELLRRTHTVSLEAFAHQDLPFDQLVAAIQPDRQIDQNPLFQVAFVFEPPLPEQRLGWTLSQLDVHSGSSKFDLTFELDERQDGIIGRVEYSTDLFEAATIARMIGHFQVVLEGVVATPEVPERRIADLPLLTAVERQQLLLAWNDTAASYPQGVCLPALFEAQVARRPEAVALVSAATDGESQYVTYGELNRRANQLAHYLRRLGVTPESVAGICVGRSPEMVVSLLGVLKAGAAYVPLDPAYPQERLAFMLTDTQAQVLLVQQHLLEHLPAPLLQAPYSLLPLDEQWHLVAQESDANPTPAATPDNLAYVIYTSGSTGQPKGVAIAHRSAVALIHWARQVFGEERLAGTLASTSICFDLSIFELFVPLSWGGTVILAETALQLPALPAAGAVTLVNTVPSALRELLRMDGISPAVRTVNLAGEPLPTALVREIYAQERVSRVFDLYGPSEDTTYSTYALRSAGGPDTIGRPVSNTRAYVLDPHLNPVPVGVPGELHLGGEGLARGYLRRPGQTAGRFVPDPFPSGRAGGRLYKTGDLVRYLPDGKLEFLERMDHQVKLRGFRIELGEIETVLAQHPSVQETAVVARETSPGDEGLVAYVVPAAAEASERQAEQVDQPSPLLDELRGYLKQRLPVYMIPSIFVTLKALPLTLNGKLDRSALPAPDRPALEGSFVAPRTFIEETLAQIWAQVLGVERVGVYDDFFALGGHSLLATRILFRVRSACQVELPLRRFLETPTVAHLAESIEMMRWVAQDVAALSGTSESQPEEYEEGEL
jgi:amino acid adenylation domain-containing protein